MNSNDILNELGTNFIEYAVAVNTDRAIPDAKSGLKPVARRILWDTYDNGYFNNKPHVKCAQIVGDTMGRFHPHGDTSIYEALVRLSRPWVMRYPLLDFHGNQGNISGDPEAAYRYTECRLAKLSEDGMFSGIKKKNVDFMLTYKEDEEEPCTLPAIFPNLLCNPNSGIGVAMACSWLPHNLREVAQAIYDYMDGKEPMIKAPDFPTGGLIINEKDLPAIIKEGHGTVKLRGQYKVDKNVITFYEIPYGETIEGILDSIAEVCNNKEIEGITDIYDNSDKKGVKLVIECAKGANVDNIIQLLFAKTRLQTSISYNQIALVNKKPQSLTLKDCIEIYITHNTNCLRRELNFDLVKYKDRVHIIDGLLIALEDIDNVIQLIKKSESSAAAQVALIDKYKLDEIQAKAILAMKLASLAKLEKIELENEKKGLIDNIDKIMEVLMSEKLQQTVIRQKLEALVKKYGDNRRTQVTQIDVPVEEKEAVVPVDVVVIVSQAGEVKRIPTTSFKVQKRNGKGIKTEEDAILTTISTNTVDYLLIFTDKGKMYKILVDKLPEGTSTSKGLKFSSFLQMDIDEKVTSVISLEKTDKDEFAIFITKNGIVKKTVLSEYTSVKRSTGIAAIKLKEGDIIKNVLFVKDEPLLMLTKKGMSIKFDTTSIGAIGRVTTGVKGISLDDGDEVLTALAVKDNDIVALVTENGYARKNEASIYPIQGRGGRGVIAYKPTTATGNLVSALIITDKDNVAVIGKPNSICVPATEIPDSTTRTCMGNVMIKNSKITSAVII